MRVIRTMTANELMDDLRSLGMTMSYDKLKSLIQAGVFPFAQVVPGGAGKDVVLILRKGYEEWVAEHAEEVEPV